MVVSRTPISAALVREENRRKTATPELREAIEKAFGIPFEVSEKDGLLERTYLYNDDVREGSNKDKQEEITRLVIRARELGIKLTPESQVQEENLRLDEKTPGNPNILTRSGYINYNIRLTIDPTQPDLDDRLQAADVEKLASSTIEAVGDAGKQVISGLAYRFAHRRVKVDREWTPKGRS